ncbi:hypothetical protein BD769DRAFT_1396922 [Suillus cothurnatus]|nr:hypothetical protein BD769DRAFT_1396922 [Suillus cothurnatus]
MVNDADATVPVTSTPPRNSGLPVDVKSTPQAVGSAVISKHIDTLGVNVRDVSPWIWRDVKNYKQCGADQMLQQLLEMCTDPSQSLSPTQKSALLDTSLQAALGICNETNDPHKIKHHLTKFCDFEIEPPSYPDFVQAANLTLCRLRKVKVTGIPDFQDDEETNVLFHINDPSFLHQEHQGKKSSRKPDVVVVSHKTAADIIPYPKAKFVYQHASKKPTKEQDNFQWSEVRTTFEFKHTAKHLPHLPPTYTKDYVVPAILHMDYMKDMDASAEPTDSTPATGPSWTYKKSSEVQNISERLRSKKRSSDHLSSNQLPSIKQSKQDGQEEDKKKRMKKKEEELEKHPIIQNVSGRNAVILSSNRSLIPDNTIYTWWFNHQHTIQCAGINFIQDLPHFVVLLLIMQRMGYKQWGLHPLFEPTPGYAGEIIVEYEENNDKDNRDKEGKQKKSEKKRVDLTFDLKSDDHTTHFGLRGHATTMFPVESKALSALPRRSHFLNESTEFIAKLFWPEEAHQKMVWFHKFEGTSTAVIRKALGIDDMGSRVLYIIVFRKLEPITTLSGDEFPPRMAIAPCGRRACITATSIRKTNPKLI